MKVRKATTPKSSERSRLLWGSPGKQPGKQPGGGRRQGSRLPDPSRCHGCHGSHSGLEGHPFVDGLAVRVMLVHSLRHFRQNWTKVLI
jgi:hypothetical protein